MINIWKGLIWPIKFAVILAVFGSLGWYGAKHNWFDGILKTSKDTANKSAGEKLDADERQEAIKVGVVTWGGYAGGQYFNEGFAASKESRFFKEYGILVEFKLIDDFNASREAFKAGEIDLLWQTADAFPTEADGLKSFKPLIVFQSDWSRGGDALVVKRTIKSAQDLRGKKIAVAPMTPSHTFLLNLLNASSLSTRDVQIIEVASAIDAADVFKKGQVDAAVVWSPDDQSCVENVNGAKILLNTKTAKNIIADIFFCKKDFYDARFDDLVKLYEGWMIGAREINIDPAAKQKAAAILADGLNQPADFCLNAINNARLCTHGDNMNFFNPKFDGVNGEQLYSHMTTMYTNAGVINGKVPAWRLVSNSDIVTTADKNGNLNKAGDEAEATQKFAPITEEEAVAAVAVSSKKVSINFATGSAVLSEEAKTIIDEEFGALSKGFSGARIRIEGNTDNTGNSSLNKKLSRERARAVSEYLIQTYNFDQNRIVVIGNGSDKPVADNGSVDGRAANRRTDFEFINN